MRFFSRASVIAVCAPFVGVVVVVTSACGAPAGSCTNDHDCARAVCVDGSCLERGIGETTDPEDPEDPEGLDPDPDGLALDLGARLHARPLFTSPPAPPPPPPPLNDDDDEELPSSCLDYLDEHEDAVSGAYTIVARSGEPTVVRCDMETDGGGWTIVADIARDGCPAGWSSTAFGDCGRPGIEQVASASFPLVVDYEEIRGGARGVSGGENRGFDVGLVYEGAESDELYVDGLALTVNTGGERSHLWTFAAGGRDPFEATACPSEAGTNPPADVVGRYSCDRPRGLSFVLWDGDGDDEDAGDFTNEAAPQGDEIEARIMSPLMGYQSPVFITALTIAVR